jgi:hypothetical protein
MVEFMFLSNTARIAEKWSRLSNFHLLVTIYSGNQINKLSGSILEELCCAFLQTTSSCVQERITPPYFFLEQRFLEGPNVTFGCWEVITRHCRARVELLSVDYLDAVKCEETTAKFCRSCKRDGTVWGRNTEAPRGLGATHMEVRSSHFALRTSTLDLSTSITK